MLAARPCSRLQRQLRVFKVEIAEDRSTLVLYVQKPDGFTFAPGQHASLQVPAIDLSWHPFSIGSAPSALQLVFFIQVQGPGSWTRKLTELAIMESLTAPGCRVVNLRGPFGYPIDGNPRAYERVIAVGTGTGIVPMFSLLYARAYQLRQIRSDTLAEARARKDAREHERSSLLVAAALAADVSEQSSDSSPRSADRRLWRGRLSIRKQSNSRAASSQRRPSSTGERMSVHFGAPPTEASAGVSLDESRHHAPDADEQRWQEALVPLKMAQLQWRLRMINKHGKSCAYATALRRTCMHERGHGAIRTLVVLVSPIEMVAGAFAFSVNHLPPDAPPSAAHLQVLRVATAALISIYAFIVVYRALHPSRFSRSVWIVLEGFAILASAATAAFWAVRPFEGSGARLPWTASVALLLLAMWRAAHLLLPQRKLSPGAMQSDAAGVAHLASSPFHLIWICRSRSLLRGYLPELARVLCGVSDHMGVLSISVYCTAMAGSTRKQRAAELGQIADEVKAIGLRGSVHFHRPCLEKVLAQDMRSQLVGITQASSLTQRTLVTYCGGPSVGAACERGAMAANALATLTNQRHGHRVEFLFREEFYGIASGAQREAATESMPGASAQPTNPAEPNLGEISCNVRCSHAQV